MSSPKRDQYKASSGKMLDNSDSVFDLTAWIKSIGVSILTAFKIKNIAGNEINPATKEDQDDIEDNQTDGSQKTQIVTNGDVVDPQNPLSCDGDSVYEKDIWIEQSDIGDFSGAIADLFNNLHSVITNITATNPKEITIHFNRTMPILVVGLGAYTGSFSNVKIIGLTSGHIESTIFDESSDNTDKTTLTAFTPSAGFNAIKIQFHTTDTVTLSNLFILKATTTLSRIQGQKPDGEFTEFQSTQSGNFKTSVEEVDGHLKDDATGLMNVITQEHHEIHDGNHYYMEGYLTMGISDTLYVKLVTPDNAKWSHFLWSIESGGILETTLHEGVSGGMTGGSSVTPVNNDRNSANASNLVITSGVTVASDLGLKISGCKWGSRQIGGGQSREDELILKQNTTYLRTFLSGASSNLVCFKATWYEHTNI
jgi:hypothetical protein